MADTSKAQKLKSSKKRYKELLQAQQKKKNTITHNEAAAENKTPGESLTSSTHSSITTEQTPEVNLNHESDDKEAIINSQLPNYFSHTNYESNSSPPAVFFDNLALENSTNQNAFAAYFNTSNPTDNLISSNQQIQVSTHAAVIDNGSSFPQTTSKDSVAFEDPEIRQNELYDLHQKNHVISESDTRNLLDYLQGSSANDSFTSAKTDAAEKVEFHQSSVESLRQLSDQMAELIEPNLEFSSTSITDLEKRNLELASQLDQEKIKSQQLSVSLKEYQSKTAKLESKLQETELNSEMQVVQQVNRLKEELQCHIQTVGMLVAEKTELSANLNQSELISRQKSQECEELQARLKTSRSLVADLEREINILKSDRTKNDSLGRGQVEALDKLRSDFALAKDQKEELLQDLLEVREKLKQSSESNLSYQELLQEVSGKLSLANVKIQQLTSGGDSTQVDGQLEQLTREKFALEKQVTSLNEMLKTITKERDESSVQYQQYAQQLNAQLTNLSNKIEQLQEQNEALMVQEQSRIKHIGELERQLQSLQNEHVNYSMQRSNNSEQSKSDVDNSRELYVQLQMEKTALEENYMKVSNEKDMLLQELQAKNDSLSQLESLVEQLRGNQPDSVKLLATMESDKVAAARAVAQNKEMKQQMEGLQEVFIKLNNDKVELTEKLTIEELTNRDLLEKLQKTEIHLQTLADAIEIKDRELSHLRDNTEELNRHVLQQDQLTDRLRHYEAQDHSSHALQTDLQDYKQTIVQLTNEINRLKLHSTVDGHELQQDLHDWRQNGVTTSTDSNHNDEMSALDKEVAMRHLEDKVKRTMADIADLTDEKQRLEHLVLQLQSETETIGEYVALYQHQRNVLKQKALEKDQQLKQLANDREQMKGKLQKLNELIAKLVVEKGSVPSELLQQQEKLNRQSGDLCEEHVKLHQELSKINNDHLVESNGDSSTETAEQIIALLSEIKASNLIQPDENVHHCPWCSGQLITV